MKYKDFYSDLLKESSISSKFIKKDIESGTIDGFFTTKQDSIKSWFEIGKIFGYDGWKNYSKVAFLNNLYIDEEARGKGLGTKLLNWFLNEISEYDVEAVYLLSDENNENVINLTEWYIKNGFERTGWARAGEVLLIYKNEI